MQRIYPTQELLQYFKSRPDTLIFEGYCRYSKEAELYQDGDSFALVVKVGDTFKCCFSGCDNELVTQTLAPLKGKVELCGVDPNITEGLMNVYNFEYLTKCYLCEWNKTPLSYVCSEKIQPISPQFAQMVSDGTHYHADTEEIKQCINLHPSAAIYRDDKPVCWCLCHLEKSLGMLYTLPEYRRKGYALEVMTALCNKIIAKGDVPFAYIVTDNTASLNLAAKYNLEQVKRADYFRFEK